MTDDAPSRKTCTRCLKRKKLSLFDERPSGGPKSYCRPCASALAKVWKKGSAKKRATRKKAARKKSARKRS